MPRGIEDSGIISKYRMQFINDFINDYEYLEVYMNRQQRQNFANLLKCGNTIVGIRKIPKSGKHLVK